MNRIGFSKDIHKLEVGLPLVIGGVIIPFEKGFLAHSDGDIVYHALTEALFGAMAVGDLGTHFPSTDSKYKGIDSSFFVKRAFEMLQEKKWKINNIDIFISIEKPRMAPYILTIRENIARLLKISIDVVSVKAGTNEGLGPIGEGKAGEATCIVSCSTPTKLQTK